MIYAGTACFILWLTTSIAIFIQTRDIAAPPVLICAVAGAFFADLFLSEYHNLLYVIYGLMLLAIWGASQVYGLQDNSSNIPLYAAQRVEKGPLTIPALTLWSFSAPAILANIQIIKMFGGPAGYLVAAKYGTMNFYGLGPLKTAISTIYPIGLCYFAYFISVPRRGRRATVLFVAHLIAVLLMALLTLSRGTLITHFVFMLLVWHHARRRVSPLWFATLLASSLVVAGIYGVVRETFSLTDGKFETGISSSDEKIKTEWMEVGTFPLQAVIENRHDVDRLFGRTYYTVITNLVPRKIWPDKPNPGGVVFTRQYVPGLYDEYSDYTTGLFPEAIMNFGVLGGVAVGVLALFALTYRISKYHIREFGRGVRPICDDAAVRMVVIYVQILWTVPLYLTGEFTNLTIGLSIKLLVYLVFFWSLSLLRGQSNKRLHARS